MGLNRKRLLTALNFTNRIIQRNFPLRTFVAPNVGNSFMGAHSFSSANALYLNGVRHPSLPTGALTVAVAAVSVVTVRNFENEKSVPQRATLVVMQRAIEARAVSQKIALCRLFCAVVSDPRAAVFEFRQIVLGDSFPHCIHGGFGAGLR
jgi:hypothetical protein